MGRSTACCGGWSKATFQGEYHAKQNRLRIVNLPDPACSPELNPIENMWAIMKAGLRRRKDVATSKDQLWEWIQEEWEAVPIQTVNKIES